VIAATGTIHAWVRGHVENGPVHGNIDGPVGVCAVVEGELGWC
jgi:hypothetical protein